MKGKTVPRTISKKFNDALTIELGEPETQRITELRLTKDLQRAAALLGREEARYYVDMYYNFQQLRMGAGSQIRQMQSVGEPSMMLQWTFNLYEHVENDIKSALNIYAKGNIVGRWAMSNPGIGPVIAAGLLAHIDITRSTYAGNLWSFAGLNPKVKWEKGQKRPWNAALKVLCVRPDQRVTTKRGYLPIREVLVGDEVLTHKGRWRKVTQVFVNEHDGDLIGLNTHGRANQTAWVTESHPVYAKKMRGYYLKRSDRDGMRFVAASTSPASILAKGSDQVIAEMRAMRSSGATLKTIGAKFGYSQAGVSMVARGLKRAHPREVVEEELVWARADAIHAGWKLYAPRMSEASFQNFTLELDQEGMIVDEGTLTAEGRWSGVPAPRAHTLPSSVALDVRMARLIGLYIAEGHVSGNHIGFAFHKDEREYQQFVSASMQGIFGIGGKIEDHKNCTRLIFTAKAIAKTLKDTFGDDAYEKRLPIEWLHADRDILASIIRGAFEGDGHLGDDQVTFTTVSSQSARWMVDALHILGIRASICFSGHVNKVTVRDRQRFYYEVFGLGDYVAEHEEYDSDGTWLTARDSDRMYYQGPVYNLEVEEDHSYVVEGFAVHNCWKIGQSMVKVCNNPNSAYGPLYKRRKAYEQEKNEHLDYADQAQTILATKKIGKETEAYKWYAMGKLPPAHIQARAERWTTRIFLSHYHAVAHEVEYKKPSPEPYALVHLEGHQDMIPIPNWPLVE